MDLQPVSSVGGFFALRTGLPSAAGAVPLARVYAGDDAPLSFRVRKVTTRLRAPEERIGVSVAHLGLAARLWSIALGPAALYGRLLDLDPERLHWDPDGTSPDDLWLDVVRELRLDGVREAPREQASREPREAPRQHASEALAGALADTVIDTHLAPLSAALHRTHRIADRLLRGNAGSALGGAVRELCVWAPAHGRPEVADRAAALGTALMRHPWLRDTGTLRPPSPGAAAGAFRRTSCCLFYRCPDGGLCGDCCFDRPPGGTRAGR